MADNFNTYAGWTLAACIAALGPALVLGQVFHHAPVTKNGYEIASADGEENAGSATKAIDWSTVDAAKGEAVFAQCKTCHTIEQGGANGQGPNLWGILGKPHGHLSNFPYSDALKSKTGIWTFEGLDAWLANPAKYAPGTKMTFAGLSNVEKRGNLIAYLNTMGSNLAMPAGPAPEAEGAEAAEAAANAAAPAE